MMTLLRAPFLAAAFFARVFTTALGATALRAPRDSMVVKVRASHCGREGDVSCATDYVMMKMGQLFLHPSKVACAHRTKPPDWAFFFSVLFCPDVQRVVSADEG